MTETMQERAQRIAQSAHGRWALIPYHLIRGLASLLLHGINRIEAVGVENIPRTGPCVLAPVHRSNLDFAVPAVITRRPIRWMAKDSIFAQPKVRDFLLKMGAFPVNRTGVDRETLAICEQVVAHGDAVVVFPEGRRKSGREIEDLFAGPAYIACRQRVPIVPIGIGGTERAMPVGARFIRRVKVVAVVGAPIYPDVPLEGRVPRDAVDKTTQRIAEALQVVYDEAERLAQQGGVKRSAR